MKVKTERGSGGMKHQLKSPDSRLEMQDARGKRQEGRGHPQRRTQEQDAGRRTHVVKQDDPDIDFFLTFG